MKNISFLSENFQFLEVKFSIYLKRHVFVMYLLLCEKICQLFIGARLKLTTFISALQYID